MDSPPLDLGMTRKGLGGFDSTQGFQDFKDRMAVVSLPVVDAEKLGELVAAEGVVFVLVTEVGKAVRVSPAWLASLRTVSV